MTFHLLVLCFDIHSDRTRNRFRKRLRQAGYACIQRSVYVLFVQSAKVRHSLAQISTMRQTTGLAKEDRVMVLQLHVPTDLTIVSGPNLRTGWEHLSPGFCNF